MKLSKTIVMACMAVVLSAAVAHAEGNAAPATPATPAATAAKGDAMKGDGMGDEMKGEKFADRKAKVLEHISQHIAEMQKKQSCVQAANDRDALKACFPNWGHRHEGKGGFEGRGKEEGNKGGASGK